MVPRRFVCLALVDAVGRVHAHFTPPGLEDQPTRASALRILDVRPAEDVAKECARCGSIVGINQGVDAGNHQTELLKSPKILLFLSIGRSSHWRSKLGLCRSLGVRWHFRQADSRARHVDYCEWVFTRKPRWPARSIGERSHPRSGATALAKFLQGRRGADCRGRDSSQAVYLATSGSPNRPAPSARR